MQIANAPCSWGIFYPEGNSLGAEGYLDAVAAAGYGVTELGPLGYLGEDPARIADALAKRGLRACGAAHVHTLADTAALPVLRQSLDRWGRLLSALGLHDLVLMDESEFYRPEAQGVVDAAGWQAAMDGLRLARRLMAEDYDIRVHLHPHVGTCIERDAQIDRALGETGISLCLDTGHHAYWDQDVMACLERHWHSIGYVHLKNVDPQVRARVLAGALGVNAAFEQGVMCALPDGAVDIGAVVRRLQAGGFAGPVVVEQDPALDAAESPGDLARRNLAFLRGCLT